MNIVVLGGGPAGLYFSLLAKRADPSHGITVLERNPPDATYGWGVVFSEETLGSLRDADRPTFDQITETWARWSAIDIRYRGATVRSRGHSFSAISRRRLLQILQRRCADLGVELRFEADVQSLDQVGPADLVVAADGVNSLARRVRQDAFRPRLVVHRTRFVWFGTDLVFKAFTFVFRQNEHGLFQVHGYPFDSRTSTFIVECPEEAWLRAGLDQATEEESIAYCEKLFADELQGRSLLSNRSMWVNFVTVTCESWHHDNLVLLGDAAHTAHFTIGSGTKLAMEDAVALAEALERHDVQAALVEYEMARQPVVERFQQAALESSTYFENVRSYADFEPVQFAFNLLTRSGRITHLELEKRDPAFVAQVDRSFAGSAGMAPPPLFAPFQLRGLRLPNRAVAATLGEDDAEEGTPSGALAAVGGHGLVLSPFVAVSAHGRITPGTSGLYRDDQVEAWRGVLDAARSESEGVVLGVRLGHSGARGSMRPRRDGLDRPLHAWPLLAASDVPYAPWTPRPHPMTADEFGDVLEDFAAAAERAASAGFDLLELDMAHGYLLAGFLSPLTNRREDGYGGRPEARMRFPLEVVDVVRTAWPSDRPLAVRLTMDDRVRGGMDVEDGLSVAAELGHRGADLIEVTAGQTVALDRPDYGRLILVPYGDRVRNEVGVPTLVGGGISTRDLVNTILAAGRADLCVLTGDTR